MGRTGTFREGVLFADPSIQKDQCRSEGALIIKNLLYITHGFKSAQTVRALHEVSFSILRNAFSGKCLVSFKASEKI